MGRKDGYHKSVIELGDGSQMVQPAFPYWFFEDNVPNIFPIVAGIEHAFDTTVEWLHDAVIRPLMEVVLYIIGTLMDFMVLVETQILNLWFYFSYQFGIFAPVINIGIVFLVIIVVIWILKILKERF